MKKRDKCSQSQAMSADPSPETPHFTPPKSQVFGK